MSLAAFGVRKPVVANLVMFAIIAGGLIFGTTLRREFFPEVRPNQVVIAAPYPGASPEEIEKSLANKIEDRIVDLDDIEEINTTISEGLAVIRIEFARGRDIDALVAETQREIDALQDLPEEADRIIVSKLEPNLPVISVSLFGGADERAMKRAIRQMRDDLRELRGMGDVTVGGVRTDEITVEVRPEAMLEHQLSLPAVSARISEAMIDLPAGAVKSDTANVTIRTIGAEDRAEEVRQIVLRAGAGGQSLRVGDVAQVRAGFVDSDTMARLNGRPAVSLTAFKTGEQDAIVIARLVKAYVAGRNGEPLELNLGERLRSVMQKGRPDAGPVSERVRAWQLGASRPPPPGELTTTTDLARFIEGRLELLTRNALYGGILVFLTLMVLLNWRISFWVAIGLIVSLMGTLMVMSFVGVTLNLLTMFGLIVVIGLLVDDAIVVAENIVSEHEGGLGARDAAIQGTGTVAWPVVATVLTTICAFLPLALIEGQIGDFLKALPVVVAVALGVSLVECLFILPAHMAHSLRGSDRRHELGRESRFERIERAFDERREAFFQKLLIPGYMRLVRLSLRYRYLSLAVALSILISCFGIVIGGRLGFTFFEANDAETVNGDLRMPIGTPVGRTLEMLERIEQAALAQTDAVDTVLSFAGQSTALDGAERSQASHIGQVILELKPVEDRERTSEEVMVAIRQALGPLPGVESFRLEAVGGGPGGPPITLTVTGPGGDQIMPVLRQIREELASFAGVYGIADDAESGQRELRIELRPGARELGFTPESLARQVRGAVFGLEAHTFAGEREDVDVRVVAPERIRRSLAQVEQMRVFTPEGTPVALQEVAHVTEGTGYATVRRLDRKRAVTVTADMNTAVTNPEEVMRELRPRLVAMEQANPGVRILERGRQQDVAESFATLPIGMAVAAGLIYVVLTWLFSSYTQPLIVMMAIPFATIGMILGHLLLGFSLTFLSLIGFIALAGVVVNDSLILMQFYNLRRADGLNAFDAAVDAGRARIRAIILTTVTTVLGLLPLMLEQSFQARFLIPMAITISFGLMSATLVTLVCLPSLLLVLEDVKRVVRIVWRGKAEPPLPWAERALADGAGTAPVEG
ncbi:MAG: efflux RND transporter permease subunit [Phycisphaerales bacterium JB039]